MYSVYDSKSESYTIPFFDYAEGRALRSFADCCQDPAHQFGKHPEDYTLFSVGIFDDNTGSLEQDAIVSIASGHTLLEA
nr:MAG: nonstructural protein [Microvirus sp.]